MQAKDIMTKNVVVLKADAKIFETIDVLVGNKISGAPVVNAEGKIIGIVSEKDLLIALDFLGEKKAAMAQVHEFMTRDVILLSEETSIKEISQTLVRENIKRIPIVKNEQVVGIVARRDILRAIREQTKS
jgi:CBS domain-containing protein